MDVPPDGCARGLRAQSSEGSSVSSESWTGAISGQETECSLPDSHRKERKIKINGGNVGEARVLRKMPPNLEISQKFPVTLFFFFFFDILISESIVLKESVYLIAQLLNNISRKSS